MFRNDEPTVLRTYQGIVISRHWHKNGMTHRDNDQPAVIYYHHLNENISSQMWYKNDCLHRDNDNPAVISYDGNGIIICQEWMVNGKCHRDKYPSVINKVIPFYYQWCKNGLLHCDDGPAYVRFDKDGNIITKTWYINGKITHGTSHHTHIDDFQICNQKRKYDDDEKIENKSSRIDF